MSATQNKEKFYRIFSLILIFIIVILLLIIVCDKRYTGKTTRQEEKHKPTLKQRGDLKKYYAPPTKNEIEEWENRQRPRVYNELPKSIETKSTRKAVESFLPNAPEWLDEADTYLLQLELNVIKNGTVSDIKISKSTGLYELDNYLIKSVKKWTYDESELKNEKINITIYYEIE